ncbi:PD-(D/E)XK nuclease family protein [Leeuwenhoekiella sp. W20_SRS_FM14]|uniref:PDDEXK-like family protein n=1 Tax=Leeuwenhoekiella sp. W20_SRS_FM14 TaxID=3240270 RepID=UPI003F99481C
MGKELEKLLSKTESLIAENKLELIKSGEDFNIFSITKIERYENNTHSAMLAELLNPKGSHHQGCLFVKEFLKVAFLKTKLLEEDGNIEDKIKRFIKNLKVKTEESVGLIDRENNIGGRIDILLYNNEKRIIIENKIDANDQDQQIVRYSNFKGEKDIIFYLTKKGTDPSKESSGDLIVNKDFFKLSYSEDIIIWLENSLKECTNAYVNQGVRQYLNLVKKITNRLETKFMIDLKNTIKTNLESAEQISNTFDEAVLEIQKSFRWDIKKSLESKLSGYIVDVEDAIDSPESSISIQIEGVEPKYLSFGIEYFNGKGGPLFCGIFNARGSSELAVKLNQNYAKGLNLTTHYPIIQTLETKEGNSLNLKSTGILSQFQDENGSTSYRQELIDHTVQQIVDFVFTHTQTVKSLS